MNVVGAIAVVVLAWDQVANGDPRRVRRARWGLWAVMAVGLAALALIHPRIEPYIDSTMEYQTFYQWHRAYLYVSTAQWVASLAYVLIMLRAWAVKPQAS